MARLLKILLVLCFTCLSLQGISQILIQFGQASLNDSELNVVPRYSWGGISYFPLKETMFVGGAVLENQGMIFDIGEDRNVHRGIGIGPAVGIDIPIGENFFTRLGYVPEIFFHYKHKVFREKSRDNKEVLHREWFSDRMNWFNHSVDFAIGHRFFALNVRYFFNHLLNEDYVNELGVAPFQGLDTQMFNIGFTWNIVRPNDEEEEEPNEETTMRF